MTKKVILKISVVLIVVFVFLFFTDIIIRGNSYYDIRKYSFTWAWLFSVNRTLKGFPIVDPVGGVKYNYRGFEDNTLDMEEYQIEYVTMASYYFVSDTCIKYFKGIGYLVEKINHFECTWETLSNENESTQYYKCSKVKNDCLTFGITKGDNNLTYVKLVLIH